MKISCNVIRDILPLYVDEVVSGETVELVDEHLAECESCREEAETLRKNVTLPPVPDESGKKLFEAVRRKWRKGKIAVISSAVTLVAASVVGGYLYLLCNHPFDCGFRVNSSKVEVTTEIVDNMALISDKRFVLSFARPDGKSLDVSRRDVQNGFVIEIREVPVDIFREPYSSHTRTLSYAYGDVEIFDMYGDVESLTSWPSQIGEEGLLPPDDYDFTITVIYKDKTVQYSMREVGLFD